MVWENHPNSKQLPWQRHVPSLLLRSSLPPWHPPILWPLLLLLHYLLTTSHSSHTKAHNCHECTHKRGARSLVHAATELHADLPPGPLTRFALCLKKNKPVGKKTTGFGSYKVSVYFHFALFCSGAGHRLFYKVILEVDKTKNWNSRRHHYKQLNMNDEMMTKLWGGGLISTR